MGEIITSTPQRSLGNYEEVIRDYIVSRLQEKYPEVSGSNISTLNDTLINPLIEVLKPIIDSINTAATVGDLSKAALMSEEDMDLLGVGNYGISRRPSNRATGTIYIRIPSEYLEDTSQPLVIGPIVIEDESGHRYASETNYIFKFDSDQVLFNTGIVSVFTVNHFYNAADHVYELPIMVTASGYGSEYNIIVNNTSLRLVSGLSVILPEIKITANITNGVIGESNEEYAARIMENFLTSPRGTLKGYRAELMNNFDEVLNVYAAGMGDELMKRDFYMVRNQGNYIYKNMGGKVDLYIQGEIIKKDSFIIKWQPAQDDLTIDYIPRNQRIVSGDSIIITNPFTGNNFTYEYLVNESISSTGNSVNMITIHAANIDVTTVNPLHLIYKIQYQAYIDDTFSDTAVYTEYNWNGNAWLSLILPFPDIRRIVRVRDLTAGVDLDPSTVFYANQLTFKPTEAVQMPYTVYENCTVVTPTSLATGTIQFPVGHYTQIPNFYVDQCTDNDALMMRISGTNWTTSAKVVSSTDTGLFTVTDQVTLGVRSLTDTCEVILYKEVWFYNQILNDGYTPKCNYMYGVHEQLPLTNHYLEIELEYNSLLEDVQNYYDLDENRVITTEITTLSASASYFDVEVVISYKGKYTPEVADIVYNASIMILNNYFEKVGLGGIIATADVVTALNIPEITQYIQIYSVNIFKNPGDGMVYASYLLEPNQYPKLYNVFLYD